MSSLPHDNVILFPKTVEYYQYELTRLLEAERYSDAMQLLVFLLGCQTDDNTAREEWQSLLDWMRMMFPDLTAVQLAEDDEEDSEEGLLRHHLHAKGESSGAYAERLLETIRTQQAPDKLLLALDQLAFLEHDGIDAALTGWLHEEELHPLIQFKTLQTLKKRGVAGSVTLHRNGESIVCDIEDTPADFDRFPSQIQEIIARVQEISEIKHPALSYFAAQTWNEFLAYIYGTSAYRQMLRQEEACVDVWAAALHLTLLERVFEGGDKEELLELYGITSALIFQWEQAYRIMQQFASAVFGRTV
ncbi:hypothetical protein [Paenibacillus puerhi]|uniref:hypothetical protein n=1 Tax=Paenibacillus puerhi TaxID=2692622 RepID=UPI001357BC24|nr:hypothetical protein [Paenibacillus puerhi]